MPGKRCMICTSIHAKKVNEMLAKGTPYNIIVAYLKDRTFETSSMTISRHKTRCLANAKVNVRRVAGNTNYKKKTDPTGQNRMKREEQIIKASDVRNAPNEASKKEQERYLKAMDELQDDVNVLNELIFLMKESKLRVIQGRIEEKNSGLVLATTGAALKDYGNLIAKFHEITAGMDSITQMRYVQLISMLNQMLCSSAISDKTRFELMSLMQDEQTRKELEAQVRLAEQSAQSEPGAEAGDTTGGQ